MRLTLAEPKYLKESIAIISELVNEGRFKITSNSIELIAMDPANVAMIVFRLLSTTFTEYKLEKDIEISINLNNLKQILRRSNPNDILSLELGADNKLKIILKGNTIRTFSLPIIDSEEREQKIPELKFPVTVSMPSNVLSSSIEDVDVVSESVSFLAEPKKFTIQAEGDLSQAKVEIKEDETTKIDAADKVKAKYSIEYLKKMIGGSKISDSVVVQFSKDYPLRIEYKEVDRMTLSFILAPRVEND